MRHAVQARDWQLAASMVVDGLAVSEIMEPRGGLPLAEEFRGMPDGGSLDRAAAVPGLRPRPRCPTTATNRPAGALAAAEGMLERIPAGQEAPGRLAAAVIRLAASRRTGDLATAAAAASRAEALLSQLPDDKLARHPEIRARVLSGRGAVELWSGHLDEAARVLEAGAAGATAPGGEHERADCLGQLALVEALRGLLRSAAKLAGRAAGGRGRRGSSMHPPPRSSHSPGCIWNATSSAGRATGSGRRTPPLAPARTG